ncbi:MAG TPA: TonB-dependent receptor, partial [Woeseiaceae bacterium]|nr:TonB-dependent receptor [Woeseiaceae bacterium]
RFIPRKPENDALDAYIDTDFSGTEEGGFNYTLSGAVNVPLVQDVLGVRLVGWRTDNDGWIDQPRRQSGPTSFVGLDEDINDEETNGGRAMLRWTPDDRLTVDAMYLRQKLETGGSPRFTAEGTPAWPDLTPELAAAIAPFSDSFPPPAPLAGLPSLTPSEDFINTDITHNPRDDDVELYGATASYAFDAGTATLSASHYEHDIKFVFDSTPVLLFFQAPLPGVTVQPQTYQTDMVEARFASTFQGPLNFVAGFYYQKDDNDFEVQVSTTDGMGNAMPWDPLNANDAFIAGGTAIFGRIRHDEIEQNAAFGELTWEFLERWSLLAGLRWFDADLHSTQATTHGFLGQLQTPEGEIVGTTVNGNPIGLLRQSGDTVRPKVSLSYQATEDVMLYALYSEGFRVGGINNSAQPFTPGIPDTYDSDELTNIELGIKSRWLGSRLQANADVFFINWDDIQVEPRDPASVEPFTTNGGEAEVQGVEWAIDYLPTESLELSLTGEYFFKHELTEDQPALIGASPFVITGLKGDEIPEVPAAQLFGSARYDTELFGKRLTLIGDVTYRGDTNTEFRTSSPFNLELDSYVLVDLYANFDLTDRFTVGAYIKNVGDELAVYDGIGTFQDPEAIVTSRPRTFGATVTWRYGD